MHRAVLVGLLSVPPFLHAQPKPDVVQQGLHGHVRSIRIEVLDVKSMQERPESEQTFDSNGWITESKDYGQDGTVLLHNIFKRDGRRMIEADSTRYFPPEFA